MAQNKKAYFQGGGGVNEPEPNKKKYKSDPAIVVQPRFKEPFYRNYDLYKVPGMEDVGPGVGWNDMQNHKSVQEFVEERRKRLQPRYVADDSWQLDSGERTKKKPKMAARMALFSKIIKHAGDENDGPNFDYGKGLYSNMDKYKSVKEFEEKADKGPGAFFADDNADYMMPPKEHGTSIYNWKNSPYQGTPGKKKKDSNDIDFPIDDQIGEMAPRTHEETYQPLFYLGPEGPPGDTNTFPSNPNLGDDEAVLPQSTEIGGGDPPLSYPDSDAKQQPTLDFGRDYVDEFPMSDDWLENLTNKYLSPKENGLFGLPDGISPPEDEDADKTISDENPDYGTTNSGNTSYEDKWNI